MTMFKTPQEIEEMVKGYMQKRISLSFSVDEICDTTREEGYFDG